MGQLVGTQVTVSHPLGRVTRKLAEEWQAILVASWPGRIARGRKLAGMAALFPVAVAMSAALVLLNLVRPVRIGSLSAKGRISGMIVCIEPYLRRLELQGLQRPLVIVINPGQDPNEQLSKMYGRVLVLLDDRHPWFRKLFSLVHRLLAALRSNLIAVWGGGSLFKSFVREWRDGRPQLAFTQEEKEAGRRLLEALGVSQNSPYICFGLREAVYYRQFLTDESKARAQFLNVEAGEDTYIRNPSLNNYVLMATRMAERGLYVLRMGQTVGEALPTAQDPRIIDYASNARTPFGDIYLLAHCKFVVAGGAGLWVVSSAFNRPVVMADNYCLQMRGLRAGDLFIPKKLWVIGEKRFLTFREMLVSYMRYSFESNCRRYGVELIHNTPEDIAAVVREMNERLDGVWRTTEEDEELQRRFNALYEPDHLGYRLPARIGTEFLRENASLL